MLKTPLSTVIGGAFWTPKATVVGGTKPSFETVMKNLFANSEKGFVYDPNDLSTMFQDAAGTVPVTAAGQPVGLMLDKSKGLALGLELNSNNFNTDLSGWYIGSSITATVVNSQARCVFAGTSRYSNARWFSLSGEAVVGKRYRVEFDATYISGGGSLEVGGTFYPVEVITSVSNNGIKTHYTAEFTIIYAQSLAGKIVFGSTAGSLSTWDIDNVSCKEVTGNHAYQTTSAARPILQNTPRRIDFDAVDDKLITTLPAQLTGCTVIRSIPSVGTQILTNQTIPVTYEDSTDHCGLIVINRTLTSSETSVITAEFNKRAGV